MKTLILQVYDENSLDHARGDDLSKDVLVLTEVLRTWCNHHQYDHSIHFLSHQYKISQEFKDYMYDERTNIHVSNIGRCNHAKFYSLIKALEYLQTNEYEYVCILDTDVSFYDKDRGIKQYLEEIDALDKDFIMGLDCVDPETYYDGKYPNGGVYLFKNTDWTKRLLDGLIAANKKVNYSGLNLTDNIVDQMQMSFLTMVCPECDNRVLITRNQNNIQCFFDPERYLDNTMLKNALFIHFAGPYKKHIQKYFSDLRQKGEIIDYDYENVFKNVIYH
jgi:hypothetical protein